MQKKIIHQGAELFYEDSGKGDVVVLLHGFAEDHRVWDNMLVALEGYRVILPDLPGSGRSQLIPEITIESMADAVLQILNKEAINEAVFIGHSMGGYITLAVEEKNSAYVKAFALFHSSAFPDSEEKKTARRKNIKFIETHGSREFLKQSTPVLFSDAYKNANSAVIDDLIESYSGFDPLAFTNYLEAMMKRPDRRHVLSNASKPVLFVIGKHDNAIPFEDSMKLCHLPSLSYIHILDQTGHMGMLEEPETSKNILRNFLKDVTAPQQVNG